MPLLLGMPLMLSPIHIAFLEMVIDPACSIVFEAETGERDLMKRPPRPATSQLLSPALALWALLQGGLALGALAAVLLAGAARGMPEDELRALLFTSLVLINVGLILINRSFSASPWQAIARPNRFLWALVSFVAVVLAVALSWPPAMALFRFGPLHLDDLAVSLAAGVGVLLVMEALKPLWRVGFRS
jgi:Ca2+-transporting ATPase